MNGQTATATGNKTVLFPVGQIGSTTGSRIRTIRRRTGLTQEHFAPTINISRGYLAKLEADIREPSKKLIRFVAEKYGISIEWFLTGQGQEFINGQSPTMTTTADDIKRRMAVAEEQMAGLKMQVASLIPETADEQLRAMIDQVVRIYAEQDFSKLVSLKSILNILAPPDGNGREVVVG